MFVYNKQMESLPSVLTLLIVDYNTLEDNEIVPTTKIWVCVRKPDTNRTHPDILSIPTQRIPKDIISRCALEEFVSNEHFSGHNPIIYIVENLLSCKLGLADSIENAKLTFEASLLGCYKGTASYANTETKEKLKMINVLVQIKTGADLFSEETASYYNSKWASVKDFMKMWEEKNPIHIEESLGGICVDGLCILSTYNILKERLCEDS